IQNISIIQRETISKVMNSIENPSFAALIVGKIARASECNVRFILSEGSSFKNADIALPSEALVTITGNLIDNALDSMNMDTTKTEKELTLGVYTRQNKLLIIVKDTGTGIPDELKEKIFENGFSTKGEGRGIGLYHTKQLITSLGGSITVESQVGIGTSFMVNL
ncbi:MAG: ATP-binding protein, partial [Treponema sp.]|nr:ATP-binding protein [Treponema sp.]